MEDEATHAMDDYKFFCFDGEPKILFVATDRAHDVKFDFFDMDFKHLDIRNGHDHAEKTPAKPKTFEKMKELAAKLSKGYPHVRVDLYEVNGQVYFGEYTLYHFGAMVPFEPEEWDYTLGSWLKLPEKDLRK